MTEPVFRATRAAALARLAAFAPQAGRAYADLRNHDLPGHPHVSVLSPYIRHRLILESEVLAAVADQGAGADKFRAEVYWRTYWKGWLELRPGIWSAYKQGVHAALNRVQTSSGLRAGWEAACKGETGIEAFDHWARELAATGYLHNHARMWFASIWIFTLRLPWELGADFFLRHLIDGDPASNTLSWRWVAGLHTPGKTYLATASNIAKFTDGRFHPQGLATRADALTMQPLPAPSPPPVGDWTDLTAPTAFLLHDDDLHPDFLLAFGLKPVATAFLTATKGRSPLSPDPKIDAFTRAAMADVSLRHGENLGVVAAPMDDIAALSEWAAATGADQIVTPYAPVGMVASALGKLDAALARQNQTLVRVLRPYDADLWPAATHGFFRFRETAMG